MGCSELTAMFKHLIKVKADGSGPVCFTSMQQLRPLFSCSLEFSTVIVRVSKLRPRSLLLYFQEKHPFVGTVELNKIAVGKSSLNKDQLRSVPYGAILTTVAVWAVWLAALGNFLTV